MFAQRITLAEINREDEWKNKVAKKMCIFKGKFQNKGMNGYVTSVFTAKRFFFGLVGFPVGDGV